MKKLCICKKSKSYPLCDNTHTSKNWSCEINSDWNHMAFCASFSYQNLGLALSSEFQGAQIISGSEIKETDRLVIITDGSDLDYILSIEKKIKYKELFIFNFGSLNNNLADFFIEANIYHINDFLNSFDFIVNKLRDKEEIVGGIKKTLELKSAFVSHSVNDEKFIVPSVDYLRKYYLANIFLCSDSIRSGANWQSEIYSSLEKMDCFLLILSKSVLESHFCSFEIGFALGMKKDIYIISIDDSMPQAFIQHIQTNSINRIKEIKPWLSEKSIFVNELLNILA